ncbi:alanyl-tRNA editing protein AlaX [Candidatus Acidianus copahuensis]|uniref:Alanyl-tRNA editing protein AlaX n=2 Tax=Sulfolobaceae TaxID=118883 RepID=A0A031LPJ7_9CREN|nr:MULTISPECIES: alanyl-tRNA editing protein AlaX [Acidianus]EZQ04738.1 alanyl-tRNA editing protein AlaX [Candidatus Acidianus copahuensis]NON63140.1 alanyl-tRNA editing protein [Acidianus sp. RZ1]
MSEEVRTHSALHVIKGALRKVLGVKWTAGTYVNGLHGRIEVKSSYKPTKEDIEKVIEESNKKIVEGSPIIIEKLPRKEAEKKYGDEIYDLFPVPAEVNELKIIIIPEWNINACSKNHVSDIKEIGNIVLSDWRYRNTKGLLEISFDII